MCAALGSKAPPLEKRGDVRPRAQARLALGVPVPIEGALVAARRRVGRAVAPREEGHRAHLAPDHRDLRLEPELRPRARAGGQLRVRALQKDAAPLAVALVRGATLLHRRLREHLRRTSGGAELAPALAPEAEVPLAAAELEDILAALVARALEDERAGRLRVARLLKRPAQRASIVRPPPPRGRGGRRPPPVDDRRRRDVERAEASGGKYLFSTSSIVEFTCAQYSPSCADKRPRVLVGLLPGGTPAVGGCRASASATASESEVKFGAEAERLWRRALRELVIRVLEEREQARRSSDASKSEQGRHAASDEVACSTLRREEDALRQIVELSRRRSCQSCQDAADSFVCGLRTRRRRKRQRWTCSWRSLAWLDRGDTYGESSIAGSPRT